MQWHCEARNAGRSDAAAMYEDIEYLMTLNDNYVFSSRSTNNYVAYSDNEDRFHEICEDILEANSKLK